jgi:16S rRNA (cytosine967-C5)-methyltransferase
MPAQPPSNPRPKKKPVSRVRGLAIDVLGEWAGGERYASDILDQAQRECDLIAPDAAFLREIVLTTLRNLSLLDHWIDVLTEDKHLDHRCRWGLRIGVSQLLLSKVSEHAAVNETVAATGRARGLINAVLRRACREAEQLLASTDSLPLETRTSHPKWLVQRWIAAFGEAKTTALCEWNQAHAPMLARANRLHPEMAAEAEDFTAYEHLPRAELAEGKVYIQDPSTLIAPRLLDPKAGMRVLDACAAPGGKTAFMAQLMENKGEIIACDVSEGRLRRLANNLRRLGVTNTFIELHDWSSETMPEFIGEGFDRILLDVPCSNTGVMRRRVDVRWRLEEASFAQQTAAQELLLRSGLRALKPDGALVYSTCSIDPEENGVLVRRVLDSLPDFHLDAEESSFPPDSGIDGAYAARIVRRSS